MACKCEDWDIRDKGSSLELERLAEVVDHTAEIIRMIYTQTDIEPFWIQPVEGRPDQVVVAGKKITFSKDYCITSIDNPQD